MFRFMIILIILPVIILILLNNINIIVCYVNNNINEIETVNKIYQEGVLITSAKLHYHYEPSKYFRYVYMHKQNSQFQKLDYFPYQ